MATAAMAAMAATAVTLLGNTPDTSPIRAVTEVVAVTAVLDSTAVPVATVAKADILMLTKVAIKTFGETGLGLKEHPVMAATQVMAVISLKDFVSRTKPEHRKEDSAELPEKLVKQENVARRIINTIRRLVNPEILE